MHFLGTSNLSTFHQRSAAGLVRTILVASATMGILAVCFVIYQVSQSDTSAVVKARTLQMPGPKEERIEIPPGPDLTGATPNETVIGRGEKIHMTLYPKEGSRAQLELTVTDWTPVSGSPNEFLLTDPDIRMRTQDGHAVRITADRGTLEAQRRSGGGLEPRRGDLIGNVVIQYDRLTEREREALPKERREQLDPDDIIEGRVDRIEFDLEFSKIAAPGRVQLTASEARLEASDLEIRLDEGGDRIESVRLAHGGRIEFFRSTPAASPAGPENATLIGWLGESLRARLRALDTPAETVAAAEPAAPTTTESPSTTATAEGAPVFQLESTKERSDKPPVRYVARIEGRIRATQYESGASRTTLEADHLRILRAFSRGDRDGASPTTPAPTDSTKPAAQAKRDRIVITWRDSLSIEPCAMGDSRCGGDQHSSITATGSPAVMSMPTGRVTGPTIAYDPDGAGALFTGTKDEPVVVEFEGQGSLTGVVVAATRDGDRFHIAVTGPGALKQGNRAAASGDANAVAEATPEPAEVEFADKLDVFGRYVRRTTVSLAGGLASHDTRVIDRAMFHGDVSLRRAGADLATDQLELTFREPSGGGSAQQSIARAEATGHVVMTRGADRVTCRAMDMKFAPTPGVERITPRSAVARGDVVAQQSGRIIRARDELILDFETVERPAPPFDPVRAYLTAVEAGFDVDSVDWDAKRKEHASRKRLDTVVRRFRAVGAVSIDDPRQPLEVDAHSVDCALDDGRRIKTAVVEGSEEQPAFVKLETLSVQGGVIQLDVPAQRADVPGAGQLTFLSHKDLDGRAVERAVPVTVRWTRSMSYRGLDNRAEFLGDVHANSTSSTQFDCDKLFVSMRDVAPVQPAPPKEIDWSALPRLWGHAGRGQAARRAGDSTRQPAKEVTDLLATGRAVAVVSQQDADTGKLASRVRIAGPKLWANLKSDVSKMQIEGAGTLLIEDFRPAKTTEGRDANQAISLFGAGDDSGPSKTLIEWRDLMWYDFAADQTRFEGAVSLRHFSGEALARLRHGVPPDSTETLSGRATYLTSDALTVEFRRGAADVRGRRRPRFGQLSADRLRQFEASGRVALQDEVERLSVTADRVVFWNDRDTLGIFGKPGRKAHIVFQRPGEMPSQSTVDRLFYNLRTGEMEVSHPELRPR